MMKIFKLLSIALTIVLGISSCSDENSTIGSSIVDTQLEIVVDSTFADLVTVKSVANDSIVGRTTNQMIGRITIPGYGRLESDFLTQFMPASTLDTMSVVRLDSLMLYLNFNDDSFTGDSLAPMRLAIYELDGQLSSPIYSNIDPTRYYDKQAAPIASKSYNASYLGQPDSLMKLGYKRIPVRLPDEMMNDVWNKYQEEPAIFSSPRLFTQYFPGFYIKNDYGSGCVVNIQNASINLHYTKKAADKDSTYAAVQSIMGVTSEVVTGNHITLKQDPQIAQDTTERKVYLQAPAGLNLQLYLPIRQVVESFENAVSASSAQGIINSMTLTVPVSPISNTYGVEPPKFLLFVRKSEMQTFFEKKLLADNVNTFYAMYDEENKCYSFSKLNTYINHIIEQKRAGIEITEADEEIMLVPVSVYTETVSSGSSYYYYSYTEEEVITDIVPYIEAPAMGVVDTENIKFQLTYSKQQGIE